MADWKVTSPIDYSPNGDDVDRFAQKSIATFEEIFEHLNVTALHDKDVLMWNEEKQAFTAEPKDVFTEDSATHTGEAGKLAYVNSDGKIHADLAGNADKIAGKPIVTDSLAAGDVLAYNAEDETFVNVPKDFVGADDVTEDGAAGKVVRVAQDGTIHADLTGDASHIGKVKVDATNWQDGDILAYHVATGTLQNEPRTGIGEAKALILRNNEKVLADYNGTKTVTVNLSTELRQTADTVTNHLERLVGTLYAAVMAAGITPDGYDAMVVENFDDDAPEIDRTVARVTSVVSGDDSVDVEDSSGLIIGAYYQLTDGEVTEEVQVKAINISDGINRVILMSPVKNQYHSKRAKFYRSTVAIQNGLAYGGGNTAYNTAMDETETFAGSNTTQEMKKVIDFSDAPSFDVSGAYTGSDGKLVIGMNGYGIVLATAGGGAGLWTRINADGENLQDSDLT